MSPLIFKADIAKKNKGNENNILPPIARIIAINKDKIIIKLRTLFESFLVFALLNQDNSKKIMTKIIIPVAIIFI